MENIISSLNLRELEEFCNANQHSNPSELRLKYAGNPNITPLERSKYEFYILQLEARRKFARKLKGFESLIYPSILAGEQASNSNVAAFHASLIKDEKSMLDMTTGLGIDFMAMARKINPGGEGCIALEMDPVKTKCLELNFLLNGISVSKVENAESIDYLGEMLKKGERVDLIYVDPARRSDAGGRLYDPAACSPDIINNYPLLRSVSRRILIKNSPMLDLKKSIELFPDAGIIYIVSWKNECKEILIDCQSDSTLCKVCSVDVVDAEDFRIEEFDISDIGESYAGQWMNSDYLTLTHENEDLWIYEPSAAVMKIGAWNAIAKKFGLVKFSPNCHLFASKTYHRDFPGRISRLHKIIEKKDLKRLKGEKWNVVTRNYPLKADALSAKLKVVAGGENFLYGATIGCKEKPCLFATEI